MCFIYIQILLSIKGSWWAEKIDSSIFGQVGKGCLSFFFFFF
jgi:hypothetical protein